MSPGEGAAAPRIARSNGRFARLAAIGALALIVIAIVYLLLSSGGGGNHYRLVFETGGQLVKGNQVLIGGVPVGSIDDVSLLDNGQAEVDITVNRPLHEGTSAIIRATSLSGIANRYISLQPGPDNAPELRNNETITSVDTTTAVDLDQLFNTLRGPERQALRNVIQGSATAYAGAGPQANLTYKYLSPSFVATDRVLKELGGDSNTLTSFLVNGASVVSAVAERRNDLSALTQNANQALGAIAAENRSFDQGLAALPGTLRQANTTLHNLRPALNDLTGLVNAAKPATVNLASFLNQLKPVAQRGVPVFKDLGRAVNLKGKANDIADATADFPPLQKRAAEAAPITVSSMQDSIPQLSFFRPYSPDLMAGVAHLNAITAYYDADGNYARVNPAGLGIFSLAGGPLFSYVPQNANNVFSDYTPQVFRRCPGGSTPITPGSNPFSSPPFIGQPIGAPSTPTDCNSLQVQPGP